MNTSQLRDYFLERAETDGTFAIAYALMAVNDTLTDEGGVGIAQNLSAIFDLLDNGTASIAIVKDEAGD
jgi:hypothetical protein